jgi:hypothetical protein
LKGQEIPTTDHVALHCRRRDLEVGDNGEPSGLRIDAFRVDDDGISVNWLEYEPGSFEDCLERIRMILASTLDLRPKDKCGVMKVEEIKQTATIRSKAVNVVHDPIEEPEPNPAHSLITGCAPDDALLQDFTLLVDLRRYTDVALATSKARQKKKKGEA